MSNFFNKIDAPQLTSSEYGNGLAEMVDNINANFQKVFTLPFLKGDDGDMVTTEFSYFWDSADCLTQDGASIFNAIFCKEGDPVFSEGLTHTDVQYILCDGGDSYASEALNIFSIAENGYNSISLFNEVYAPSAKPKILMYYKIASETQTPTPLGAAQLYYYFDARVGNLSKFIKDSSSNTYKENFSDYTCILSTQYNTEGDSIAYKFVKQSGWPTLYFDDSSKQFCWQINGVRTGVNAQGVSGKDGRGNKIWLCQVNPSASNENYEIGRMIKFDIVDIWSNDDNGWVEYDKMKSNAGSEENFLRKGDVVIGYLSDSTIKDKKDKEFAFDQILGVIDKEQSRGEFYVCSNLTQNTSNTFFNTRLYNLCARIGSHEDAADAMMKGFIIPDGKTSDETGETGGHALYEGTFDKEASGLYLVHTNKIGNIQHGGEKIALENNGTPLNVYYNTSISGSATVSKGMVLSGNNPGAGGAWSNDEFVGKNAPLIINTDGADITTAEKLIIGPADIYCVNQEYKPTTLCINQRPGAEVVLGYNIMKVNDSGVGVGGDLGVTGNATISGDATITGITTLNDTLTVNNTTTLNGDLILNSRSSGSSYYSSKIIFQRNNLNDSWNDWYMYGNDGGQLEIGCIQSNNSNSVVTLSYTNSGAKSMEVDAGITSTVDGVQGVYTGMPVGTIIQWLDFSTSLPRGYVYWINSSGMYRINSLFNTYLTKDNINVKSLHSFISTEDYLKNNNTKIGNDAKTLLKIDDDVRNGFPSINTSDMTFQSTDNCKKGTISHIYSTATAPGKPIIKPIPKVIEDNLENIPVIFQTTNYDWLTKEAQIAQKYYLLRNESSLLNIRDNTEHRQIQKRILAGLFNHLGYNIVSQLKNGTAVFYFNNAILSSGSNHYGYLFYNFKDEPASEAQGDALSTQRKVSYDFIQIYGKELTKTTVAGFGDLYNWDGDQINTVTPIYDNEDYNVNDEEDNMSFNHTFALNFQNIITDRTDIVGTHNILKYL